MQSKVHAVQLTWKNSADISKKGASKSSSYTDLPSSPRIISIWQAFRMAPLVEGSGYAGRIGGECDV